MQMNSPLSETYNEDRDKELIEQALNGSKAALEELVGGHQSYVYNLAWKMCGDAEDAKDIAQEVLVKMVTNLTKFKGLSSFRTWLYRITMNHFLTMKKSKMENRVQGFEQYGHTLDAIPDVELTAEEQQELEDTIKDGQFRCMSAMLLCLTREQRLAYILGDVFGGNHVVASELLGITRANYRMRLSRARKDLYHFMNHKCGLVNKNNPCRCRKKTTFAIQGGFVDPNDLKFHLKHEKTIAEVIGARADSFGDYYEEAYTELQCKMPFNESIDLQLFERIINDEAVQELLHFE